jgi:hypothetical protein
MIAISDVKFTATNPSERDSGMLGYMSFLVNGGLRLDGITLRRTMGGKLTLSFPARRDRRGGEHHLMRPISDAVRIQIEQQVFDALGSLLVPEAKGAR